MTTYEMIHGVSLFSDFDIDLFKSGHHFKLYEKLGSHPMEVQSTQGVYFSVWAPNAKKVSVIGDFNWWNSESHPLANRWDGSGIWEGFITGIEKGCLYKYKVVSNYYNYSAEKSDPFALLSETPPKTASVVWDLDYKWKEKKWEKSRHDRNSLNSPISIYEMHIGSWKKVTEHGDRSLGYRELSEQICEYVKKLGFTHVEFMPVMEHPFYGSWGYQTTGYFSATSRYGVPQDLMFLIDSLHDEGISVILDWVPSHFPTDEHGLGFFDGTHLYEHSDPMKGFHPDWKSYIFNYDRNEVRSFLISSAHFWFDRYHIDGLRVDGVASMLYLDYSREQGKWIANEYGGRENLGAISLLKELNESIYNDFPHAQVYAEESTAWPGVSRPTYSGGLGFGFKWNMGWMHDTLKYFEKDPIYRKYHQNDITFSILYAFTENFVLPLSHDEVVHGKGSLLSKMPGDDWQKFANLRALYAYMWAHPGKKLLFMGGEFGQWEEWNHNTSLDWHLMEFEPHNGITNLISDLNRFYKNESALYEYDLSHEGFEWVDNSDHNSSVLCFLRRNSKNKIILVVCNFTPTPRHQYRIGVPYAGDWKESLNTDSTIYGGSGIGNAGLAVATEMPWHFRPYSICITLPPLSVLYLLHDD
ncbi:MAG TPA: 1,4-alpha-glucan branching protein GlgB [Thermodesulfobacteriota bacterium]|nr:1,4-alpha-glucan branching protein GlgB [Thermodesulfobacteriota bacterium]